jgi:hypothetical protein
MSSSGSDDEAQGQAAGPTVSDFAELIAPMPLAEFRQRHWGKEPYTTRLPEDTLARLLGKGFMGGDLGDVLRHCRNDDNSRYTRDEITNLENDFEGSRRTVNAPHCFCPGACDIQRAFSDSPLAFGLDDGTSDGFGGIANGGGGGVGSCYGGIPCNDIEVGVYFAKAGGDLANWHYDNNHNLTIQLRGRKDWHLLPGDAHTTRSAGMHGEPPKNRHEQRDRPVPPAGYPGCSSGGDAVCHRLSPGSVLYLPPGYWHQVSTVSGGGVGSDGSGSDDCLSVDLRVANLVHARWISEALFAGLLDCRAVVQSGDQAGLVPLEHQQALLDTFGHAAAATTSCFGAHLSLAQSKIGKMLARCPVPRCIPWQADFSDGMDRGASLSWLMDHPIWFTHARASRHSLPPGVMDDATSISGNPMVSVSLKRQDGGAGLAISFTSVSTLTSMEYCRFTLYCTDLQAPSTGSIDCAPALEAAVGLLVKQGSATVGELRALVSATAAAGAVAGAAAGQPGRTKGQVANNKTAKKQTEAVSKKRKGGPKGGPDPPLGFLDDLLRVLVFANLLVWR